MCRWLHVHREEVDICMKVTTCTSRGGRYLCVGGYMYIERRYISVCRWLHVHREEVGICVYKATCTSRGGRYLCVGGYMYIERR